MERLIQLFRALLSKFATLNSPTFTGSPKAPTASAGTSTTQVATTAFANRAAQNPPTNPTQKWTIGGDTLGVQMRQSGGSGDQALSLVTYTDTTFTTTKHFHTLVDKDGKFLPNHGSTLAVSGTSLQLKNKDGVVLNTVTVTADKAAKDGNGNNIASTYSAKADILEAALNASYDVVRSGSLSADDVLAEIENAKSIASSATATARTELDSKFSPFLNFAKGSFTKTLLFGGTAQSNWMGAGNITLAQSWKNFDALVVFLTNDGSNSWMTMDVVYKWQIEWLIELGKSSGKGYIFPFSSLAGHYWGWTPAGFGTTSLTNSTENSGIQAIYGIKFK